MPCEDGNCSNTAAGQKRPGALELGPRKKPCVTFPYGGSNLTLTLNPSCNTDPLVHHGRHFGRTVHALCTVSALLNNGILRMGELAEQPEETFTHEYVFSVCSRDGLIDPYKGASRA